LKNWLKTLPLAIGSFLSIASVLFMVRFVRSVEVDNFKYMFEYPAEFLPSLIISFLLCILGVPLVYRGLELLEKSS